jgi:hypothetical protein
LTTSIGPITASSLINSGFPFPTSQGAFILTSAGNVTYTAVVGTATVPEPSTVALTLVALLAACALSSPLRQSNGAA